MCELTKSTDELIKMGLLTETGNMQKSLRIVAQSLGDSESMADTVYDLLPTKLQEVACVFDKIGER
jgi:hypothetical protein